MDLLNESTLPDYARKYLTSLIEKQRLPSTIRRYTYDLEDFFRWLRIEKKEVGFNIFKELTTANLEQFFILLQEERHYAPRTVKRVMTVVNQLYRYYEKQGQITNNPMKNITFSSILAVTISEHELLTIEEQKRLLTSIKSNEGLTENQLKARPFQIDRNLSIIHLFLYYGLTLQELNQLNMHHIHFESGSIHVPSLSSVSRTIKLTLDDKKLLYSYYNTIPKPVRPRYHSHDPFFIAFDFQRNTYRWSYEIDQPKRLTEIAIQKMIRQEVKRAGLRKGISAQHLRNTFAVQMIKNGESIDVLKEKLGLKTTAPLQRYIDYVSVQQISS